MDKKNSQRFYEYGFQVGLLLPGRRRRVSDVAGVTVGHATKILGNNIRTGITIIDPGIKNLYRNKIPAAIYVGNGYGKMAGLSQVEELGTLEAPIALTSSGSVGVVLQGMVDLVASKTKNLGPMNSINVVVGDINDGRINDIHAKSISETDVENAYASRRADFALGSVGGGTGARAFSWKGGIGTASRIVSINGKQYTLGVLIQTNYGGSLTILGVPIGEIFGKNDFDFLPNTPDGSCNIIVATNAPLTSRQLKRIAKRAFLGIIRTGSIVAHASGDYSLAFSTNRIGLEGSGNIGQCLRDDELNPLCLAAVEATEESVYDALFAARTMKGRGGKVLETLPQEKVVELLKRHVYRKK